MDVIALYYDALEECRRLGTELPAPAAAAKYLRLVFVEKVNASGDRNAFVTIVFTPDSSRGGRPFSVWSASTSQPLSRHAASIMSTLSDSVTICPYAMSVTDSAGDHYEWQAGQLNVRANALNLAEEQVFVATQRPDAWLTDGQAPVLGDGLWLLSYGFGIVVNLTGENAPTLAPDRRRIEGVNVGAIEVVARDTAQSAVADAWAFAGNSAWIDATAPYFLSAVDAIVDLAARTGKRVVAADGSALPLARVGYLVDTAHLGSWQTRRRIDAWVLSRRIASGLDHDWGIDTSRWPDVLAARPSDAVFLGTMATTERGLVRRPISPWVGDAAGIYDVERHLAWPIPAIVGRARELGLEVPAGAAVLPPTSDFVRRLLDRNDRWLIGRPRRFRSLDVVLVAERCSMTLAEASDELARRALDVHDTFAGLIEKPPTALERVCVSLDHTGVAPWISTSELVERDTIYASALATGLGQAAVVEAFCRLGYQVEAAVENQMISRDEVDMIIESRDHDGRVPFLDPARAVSKRLIGRTAEAVDVPAVEIERRLTRLGYSVTARPAETARGRRIRLLGEHLAGGVGGGRGEVGGGVYTGLLTSADVRLAAVDYDLEVFRPLSEQVSPLDALLAASAASTSLAKARRRLIELGYTVAPHGLPFKKLAPHERLLLSVNLQGWPPWRDARAPVHPVDVVAAAARTRRTVTQTLATLHRLGLQLLDVQLALPIVRPGAVDPLNTDPLSPDPISIDPPRVEPEAGPQPDGPTPRRSS